MKRESEKFADYHGKSIYIYKFWHWLFWEHCLKCKKEFVRESGWRYCMVGFRAMERIVCKECCPTKKSVGEYFRAIDDAAFRNKPSVPYPYYKKWKKKNV